MTPPTTGPPADAPRGPVTHPLPFAAPYRDADYAFLTPLVAGRSIVQLGESIHVTEELPRARLPIVRYLHAQLGYDVLAFEGSAVDAWLAQDLVYRSTDDVDTTSRRAQQAAWFALWDTEPMRAVMAYVVASRTTPTPLYLASFDIQPGNTRTGGGKPIAAVSALVEAVGAYAESTPAAAKAWPRTIAPILGCFRDTSIASAAQREAALKALDELEQWLLAAAPRVAARTTPMHAAALRRLGPTLRDGTKLCLELAQTGPTRARAYQALRDELNARNAIALRDEVSASHRVMLWAHHSHVHHNSIGELTPSMGQYLRRELPAAVYTIGSFAGGGTAMAAEDGKCPPIDPRPLERTEPSSEALLATAASGDAFIELSTLDRKDPQLAAWLEPTYARMEIKWAMPTILPDDFDAAIFVREVHHAELISMPAAARAVMALKCGLDSNAPR